MAIKNPGMEETELQKKLTNAGTAQPGDAVSQAQELLRQQSGKYTSPWQAQLNDTMGKILNREKFSYDLNGDALYNQYKDLYTTQGRMAMMDTMGQAAALTGGYGNSYAQGVGQQAYQGYLQQLNARIPELYQMAMNRYQMEGDALTKQYGVLADQDAQEYGRYRDTVADQQWQAEFDEALRRYNFEHNLGEFAPVKSEGGNLSYDYTPVGIGAIGNGIGAIQDAVKSAFQDAITGDYSATGSDGFQKVKSDYIYYTGAGGDYTSREKILQQSVNSGMITPVQAEQIRNIYKTPTKGYTAADKIWDRNG